MRSAMKKALCIALTALMLLSTLTIFAAFKTEAATGYENGYKQTMSGTGVIITEGLDISEHQAGLNLQKVKDAGYDYVILRIGIRLKADNTIRADYQFENFYKQARAVGLDVGGYFYSRAKSEAEAREEAEKIIEYTRGKQFEYPIYVDFEDSYTWPERNSSTASKATTICYALMNKLADAGYLVGLYGYAAWFDDGYNGWMSSKLNNDIGKKYEFWMANYYDHTPTNVKSAKYPTKYGMYQYTSSKTISGWSGKLDANVSYKDYPSIVKQYGFNGYEPGGAVVTEPATEKPTETVQANKYAINDDIKKVKDHIGSGISKYSIDDAMVSESESYALNAGQTISIKGFVGFKSDIKDFGYYFDDDADNAVWGIKGTAAADSIKKKAGDKAKSFEISADTTGLSDGEHTVTYVVKYGSKTCDLITLKLNVGATAETDSAPEGGCNSAIGIGSALSIIACIGGASLVLKKKRED